MIAVGTRLGLQQTGFAWEEFAPLAKIYQIDIDKAEILKGHPKIEAGLQADAGAFLSELITLINKEKYIYSKWLEFGNSLLTAFPLNDVNNVTGPGYISPYDFMEILRSEPDYLYQPVALFELEF